MKTDKLAILDKWSRGLKKEEMRHLLIELIDLAYDGGLVAVGDLAPYWSKSGEPLVPGQSPFAE